MTALGAAGTLRRLAAALLLRDFFRPVAFFAGFFRAGFRLRAGFGRLFFLAFFIRASLPPADQMHGSLATHIEISTVALGFLITEGVEF